MTTLYIGATVLLAVGAVLTVFGLGVFVGRGHTKTRMDTRV